MSKIIFFTDLHHGGDLPPLYPGDISIYGEQWGLPLLRGLISYAEKTPDCTVISGGDEVTFKKDILRGPNELPYKNRKSALQAYLANARDISNAVIYSRVYIGRTVGNHDPIKDLDKLGITRNSHIFARAALPDTDVIVCQPEFKSQEERGPRAFAYDPSHIIDLIDQSKSRNLVISSHWAWDRHKIGVSGKGYQYRDRTEEIRAHIDQRLREGSLNSVLTLHGHSHRFQVSGSQRFSTITVPSISQNDLEMKETPVPCGIFAEVTVNEKTGNLSLAFKRIRLKDERGDQFVVQNVAEEEILAYRRGAKPRTVGLRARRQ